MSPNITPQCVDLTPQSSFFNPLLNQINLLGNDFLNLEILNAIQRGGNLFLEVQASHGDILLFPGNGDGAQVKWGTEQRSNPPKHAYTSSLFTCFL